MKKSNKKAMAWQYIVGFIIALILIIVVIIISMKSKTTSTDLITRIKDVF